MDQCQKRARSCCVSFRGGCTTDSSVVMPLDESICKNVVAVPPGKWHDGTWLKCNDSADQECVVYSAGAKNDITFDIEMVRQGCEVHTFDPTLKLQHLDSTMITAWEAGVNFHNLGLGGVDTVYGPGKVPYTWPSVGFGMMSNREPWEIKTLHGIMTKFGHTMIEVLKIDVEGAEWSFLEAALRDPYTAAILRSGQVRQILMEVHFMP